MKLLLEYEMGKIEPEVVQATIVNHYQWELSVTKEKVFARNGYTNRNSPEVYIDTEIVKYCEKIKDVLNKEKLKGNVDKAIKEIYQDIMEYTYESDRYGDRNES